MIGIGELRPVLLAPWRVSLSAPNRVALYLFGDGSWVVENFNNQPADVELNGKHLTIEPRGWSYHWN